MTKGGGHQRSKAEGNLGQANVRKLCQRLIKEYQDTRVLKADMKIFFSATKAAVMLQMHA